jgi:hypothetical protein
VATPSTIPDTGRVRAYTDRFDAIFRAAANKHDAHARSAAVMADLVNDESFLGAALARELSSAEALNRRNYPVVSIEVESNPFYELVVNCWIPLPSGDTDVTTKAIHHHGEMLLTTGAAFGPGYEHWMLAKPELLDADTHLHRLRLLEHGVHERGGVAFVDAYVAHVPLYTDSLTITVCLWSSRSQKTWKDTIKRVGVRAGLAGTLDLKVVDTFDFYPTEGGFTGMPEREEFPYGPNEDFLHSLFHVVQETGNSALAPTIEATLAGGGIDQADLVRELLDRLRAGEPIRPRLSAGHYGVPHANFRRADIERALATQP